MAFDYFTRFKANSRPANSSSLEWVSGVGSRGLSDRLPEHVTLRQMKMRTSAVSTCLYLVSSIVLMLIRARVHAHNVLREGAARVLKIYFLANKQEGWSCAV